MIYGLSILEMNDFYSSHGRMIWLVVDNVRTHMVPPAGVEVNWTAELVRHFRANHAAGSSATAERAAAVVGSEAAEQSEEAGEAEEGEAAVQHLRGFHLSHIHVVFLPPNLTSDIQPMDQGIIEAFGRMLGTEADTMVDMQTAWEGDCPNRYPKQKVARRRCLANSPPNAPPLHRRGDCADHPRELAQVRHHAARRMNEYLNTFVAKEGLERSAGRRLQCCTIAPPGVVKH